LRCEDVIQFNPQIIYYMVSAFDESGSARLKTLEKLGAIAAECSDNEAAKRLNEARAKLFQSISKSQLRAA
jgi:hypothetical protein